MPRTRREESPSGVYHVIIRGAGRHLLFEDDYDRRFFLSRLFRYANDYSALLLAWCLMENHVHILFRLEIEDLMVLMRSLNTSFARFFNDRHGHVGPVFQDRYKSIPVKTDAQLLETVRYIHCNPQSAGIGKYSEYEWSSYMSYLSGSVQKEAILVIRMLGGIDRFASFHEDSRGSQEVKGVQSPDYNLSPKRRLLPDEQAIMKAKELYGDEFMASIARLPKVERNAAITHLRGIGLSVRQIERLTGIGRGIIQRCS